MVRRGFGDETWRLAKEGDVVALRRVADILGDDLPYDSHRARAFALAVEGQPDPALAELNEGWTEEWPFPGAYAVDVARVHFLAGDCRRSLAALDLSMRGTERPDTGQVELAAACVRRQPRLWRSALRVAFLGGSLPQRGRTAFAVLGARLARNP